MNVLAVLKSSGNPSPTLVRLYNTGQLSILQESSIEFLRGIKDRDLSLDEESAALEQAIAQSDASAEDIQTGLSLGLIICKDQNFYLSLFAHHVFTAMSRSPTR